ncbi:MAG: 4Fe-4S binding protein [Halobacteriota archaeon]
MGIPVVEQERCTGCRECISVCEVTAIDIVNEKAVIDYEKCYGDTEICRACIEMCPQSAIFEME